uniref:Uncharacterized protein n=1 Tax=Chelonoidis abingdonii TaxID=106734 RepID=A0A8C0HD25_CHEAB
MLKAMFMSWRSMISRDFHDILCLSPRGPLQGSSDRQQPPERALRVPASCGRVGRGRLWRAAKGVQFSLWEIWTPFSSQPLWLEGNPPCKAIASNMANNQKEAVFQNSNAGETSCKLLTAQNIMEDPSSSQRKDSSPVVICQLKGGTQILCINSSGTRELKTVHLVPQYQNQDNYLQSGTKKMKITNRIFAYYFEQLENGSLQSVASSATFQSEVNLQGPTKMTLVG